MVLEVNDIDYNNDFVGCIASFYLFPFGCAFSVSFLILLSDPQFLLCDFMGMYVSVVGSIKILPYPQ